MRILVTRPGSRAGQTEQRLRDMGHEVIVAPVLTITPSGAPMPPGVFDAIILTSPGSLMGFPEPPVHLPVLAVGNRTAEDARRAGFLHVMSAAGDRHDLAEMAREALPPERRLLMAVGRERKEDLADMLRHAGHDPVIWICYYADAVPDLDASAADALGSGKVDCILHFSPRSAAVFIDLARRAGVLDASRQAMQVCISRDAADVLEVAGFQQIVTAARPDEDGMIAALDGLNLVDVTRS